MSSLTALDVLEAAGYLAIGLAIVATLLWWVVGADIDPELELEDETNPITVEGPTQ